MSRKTKTERYQEILSLPNVSDLHYYREGDHAPIRGKWAQVFGNNHPITLELACGKGEYAIGLGARYPERNFIGLDIKGDRIWKGATRALDAGLKNVHFLRTRIDNIVNYFAPGEIAEIWLAFPDPYLKKSKKRKRLTHPVFLRRYDHILQPGGLIHLKTDSEPLFKFTLEVIDFYDLPVKHKIFNLYRLDAIQKNLDIQTYYEKKHISSGHIIKYIAFGLNDAIHQPVSDKADYLS